MADVIRLKGEGGAVWAFDLPLDKVLAKQLEKGQLKPADDDARQLLAAATAAEEPNDSDDGNDGDPSRPANSAKKAEWVAYAQSRGIDTEGLTKDELVDAVDELDA